MEPIDDFLGKYQPSELKTASEFLTTWLPFLSKDLCKDCVDVISDRIRSLDTGTVNGEIKAENMESEVMEKTVSPGMCWADMAQEDDLEDEENKKIEHDVDVSPTLKTNEKRKLSTRGEREEYRFMNVKKMKTFSCFENVRGERVNILDGLELHTSVFSAVEQKRIVDHVYELEEMGRKGELQERTFTAPRKWMKGKGRVTIQFGCCYNYATDKEGNTPGILQNGAVDPIPSLFKVMIRRLVGWHVIPPTCVPDSCIVNIYDEGDCIPPHIDNHDFVRPFCTVSFISECEILFGSNLKILGPGEFSGSYSIPLPIGSVLVLKGNGADVAKHCVPAVPTKRISITFRKMDEAKRPFGFIPEPDLQGIKLLPYKPTTPITHVAEATSSSRSRSDHNGSNYNNRRVDRERSKHRDDSRDYYSESRGSTYQRRRESRPTPDRTYRPKA